MFKKCLKYDLRSFYKIWLIAAAIMLLIAVLGGLGVSCLPIASTIMASTEEADFTIFVGVAMIFIGVISYIAIIYSIAIFTGGTNILLYIRYYMNFFSDQGYLTFTLPVKRSTLFWSKTVSGLIYLLATALVSLISFGCLFLGFCLPGIISPEVAAAMDMNFEGLFSQIGAAEVLYTIVLLILYVILMVALEFASLMMEYLIITFAATLFRSHKVIGVIGVYIGISIVFAILGMATYVVWGVYLVCLIAFLAMGLSVLFTVPFFAWLAIYMLMLVAIAAALTVGMTFANFSMQRLERKLNLA